MGRRESKIKAEQKLEGFELDAETGGVLVEVALSNSARQYPGIFVDHPVDSLK